jgi:hypothetical protein
MTGLQKCQTAAVGRQPAYNLISKSGRTEKVLAQPLPHLDQLQAQFGRSAGLALSELLGDIRENGLDAVKAERPRSTLARQIAKLREAKLIA